MNQKTQKETKRQSNNERVQNGDYPITDRQSAYLTKLGVSENDFRGLTMKEASALIVETIKAQKKAEKPSTTKNGSTKKETSKKETEKPSSTKKATTTKTTKSAENNDMTVELEQAIREAYNGELKKELSFVPECKIDELAKFIVESCKKDKCYGLNTEKLIAYSKKFVDGLNKKPAFSFSFEKPKATNTKAKVEPKKENTTKKETTKTGAKTTAKAQAKDTKTKVETKKKVDIAKAFSQLEGLFI